MSEEVSAFMLQIKVMKVVLVFLIFLLTASTTVLASTGGYSLTARSKISSMDNKASSKAVSLSSIHRTRKLLIPDEVIIIVNPAPETFNSIRVAAIPTFKISSNNLSDIFIPPKAIS